MYKVLYNNITIDVIKKPIYCKYLKSGRTLRTDKVAANCIVSPNGMGFYHLVGKTPEMPEIYKSVEHIEIDQDEYDYLNSLVTEGKPIDIDLFHARDTKIEEMSAMSERIIHAGTDITLSDGMTYHFSFSDQDQFQIGFLATAAKNAQMLESMGIPTNETGKDYPWHADGGDCIFYSRADMITIGSTMQNYITYHNSYFHALRNYINEMHNPLKIMEIKYGVNVPGIYCGDVYQAVTGA